MRCPWAIYNERKGTKMLVSVEKISKAYADRIILDEVSLYVNPRDRIGIIGVNGNGKSTLLKIIANAEEPDSGSISKDPNARIEYLPQNPQINPEYTVLEQVFDQLSPQARELQDYEAKSILTQLGITNFAQPMGQLSGGQRKRVALASALVHDSDMLMLDEPTNHLDNDMVEWLEGWLRQYRGAVLMITHDRYFLERVVSSIIEVERGALHSYPGSYSQYLHLKAQKEEMEQASERKRQSILRREYQWVLQGPKARGTKSRDRLERYEELKNQETVQQKQALNIGTLASRLGRKTITMTNVSKSFDGQCVLDNFSLQLHHGDRIGIVGKNGSGKSTLLNLIHGRLQPDNGEIEYGETVQIGYFSQETPVMNPQVRVIDYIKEFGDRIETTDGTLSATQFLEMFLFPKESQWTSIAKLSGGEKRRLFLMSILIGAPNILLLDEPTNDLDIQTLTILEDYLETYPGIVLTVSHDRYFLDKVVHTTLEVGENGVVTAYIGSYDDYLSKRPQRISTPTKMKKDLPKEPKAQHTSTKKARFSFKEQREYSTIDQDIADLEKKLQEIQVQQAENVSDYVLLQQLHEEQSVLESQLEEKMERWVYLTELAEEIEKQS